MKTYPSMNEQIKMLLKNGESHDQYAYARIIELEKEIDRLRTIEKAYQALLKAK